MKIFKKRNIFLLIIAAVLFLTSCSENQAGNPNAEKKTIKIGYLPITHSVPVMLMSDLSQSGDDPYKIELVKFSSWSEVVEALRTKRVDGANILFEVALRAKEADDDLVMISLSHRNGNVIVVDKDISSYQDLKGKTVAIPHKLSPQNTLLHMVLEREGMQFDDITVIEVNPSEMPSTMAGGAISAYLVAEPYGSVAESTGAGRILETSDSIYPDAVCCVMVFRKETLNSDGEINKWVRGKFGEAAAMAQKKDDDVVNAFKKYSNFSDAVIKNSLTNVSYDNLDLTEEEYKKITDAILHYGVLSSVPLYKDFAGK